ncbi:MAG TPA: SRPBCC family protein, partial [Polyangiaceae bacterium LLY-WYZ-14_1]|nr:SRPBCC family protein [Polyangiaceae bacterium LLY-WYZ-14_1]
APRARRLRSAAGSAAAAVLPLAALLLPVPPVSSPSSDGDAGSVGRWSLGPQRAQAQRAAARPFTSAERRRLARGELVMRSDEKERDGRLLIGGASWQRIRLPPAALWKATNDVPRYHRLLPEVRQARVVRRRGSHRKLVFLQHSQGPITAEYHLWFTQDDEDRIARFRVDRNHPGTIRAGWGFLAVYPYRNGHSVLSFGIEADIGRGLLQSLVRDQVHEWMLRVPQTVKWYAEGSGRRRYLRLAGLR